MPLIIGVGNQSRGDDGAGLRVARMLRALRLPGAHVLESAGDAGELIEAWRVSECAFVIDAARAASTPGAIYRFDVRTSPITVRTASHSTHDLGLADAAELARALGCLPARLVVYAIEGADFTLGAPLSPPVTRACRQVVERIVEELRSGGS